MIRYQYANLDGAFLDEAFLEFDTLRQVSLEGVSLEFRADTHDLSGRIDDPAWGPLTLAGLLDPQSLAGSLAVEHPGLALGADRLRRLPLLRQPHIIDKRAGTVVHGDRQTGPRPG